MCICTYTTSASEDVKEIGKKEELFFCKPAWVGSNGAVRQWRAFRLLCKPADTSSAGAARSSGCRQLPVRRRRRGCHVPGGFTLSCRLACFAAPKICKGAPKVGAARILQMTAPLYPDRRIFCTSMLLILPK